VLHANYRHEAMARGMHNHTNQIQAVNMLVSARMGSSWNEWREDFQVTTAKRNSTIDNTKERQPIRMVRLSGETVVTYLGNAPTYQAIVQCTKGTRGHQGKGTRGMVLKKRGQRGRVGFQLCQHGGTDAWKNLLQNVTSLSSRRKQ
jgi:hypothetical protein